MENTFLFFDSVFILLRSVKVNELLRNLNCCLIKRRTLSPITVDIVADLQNL